MKRAQESRTMVEDVNKDAFWKYMNKEIIKGDSWRDMSVPDLYDILRGEIDELTETIDSVREDFKPEAMYNELLDVINLAKMVGARIKEDYEI